MKPADRKIDTNQLRGLAAFIEAEGGMTIRDYTAVDEYRRCADEIDRLRAIVAEQTTVLQKVDSWLVCAAITTADDMMGAAPEMHAAVCDAIRAATAGIDEEPDLDGIGL